MGITSDQIGGFVRLFMGMFSAWALSHGFSDSAWLAVTGGVVALVAGVWSWYTNSTLHMIASVAEHPDVKKVVTTPSIALAVPSPKVIAG